MNFHKICTNNLFSYIQSAHCKHNAAVLTYLCVSNYIFVLLAYCLQVHYNVLLIVTTFIL